MNMNCGIVKYTITLSWILFFYSQVYSGSGAYTRRLRCSFKSLNINNGYLKLKSRGRIAKFYCNYGYRMFGLTYSACRLGRWTSDAPKCVKAGCQDLIPPMHGTLIEKYSGDVASYECDPGYSLNGSTTIYCNGINWNDTIPTCTVSSEDPSTSCDFDNPRRSLCGWSHDPTGDFYWTRHQFATPSSHVDTGPTHDHTKGEGNAGYYMYIEASNPRKENDTARLYSPVYVSSFSKSCFTFWYHMYGKSIGWLLVYVKTETDNLPSLHPVWQKSGDQGNVWLKATLPIRPVHDNFQIVIEGVRGENYAGDIAVDDVSLQFDNCEDDNISTSCKGRCGRDDDLSICSCTDECVETTSCCDDYPLCILDRQNVTVRTQNSTAISIETVLDDIANLTSDIENVMDAIGETTNGATSTDDVGTATSGDAEWTTNELGMSSMTSTQIEVTSVFSGAPDEVTSGDDAMQIEITSTVSAYHTVKSTRYPRTRWWYKNYKPNSMKRSALEKPSADYMAIGIIVGVAVLIIAGVLMFYLWRRRHKKLTEDSDMRYLPENEEIEYYENHRNSIDAI